MFRKQNRTEGPTCNNIEIGETVSFFLGFQEIYYIEYLKRVFGSERLEFLKRIHYVILFHYQVTFNVELEAKSCEAEQTIEFDIKTSFDNVKVKLELICECECGPAVSNLNS